ncbi:MAG: carboxypeptidase-like regulatory domain-containing protein [Halobacteriota archaeon]
MKKKILSYGLSAIVLLSVLAMVMPASAAVQMADDFGVEDAMGNPNTYVEVPVNITNTANGPISDIGFYLHYNENVLNLTNERIMRVGLASDWPFIITDKEGEGVYFIGLRAKGIPAVGIDDGTPIGDGITGSVVLLNFSVVGGPGTSSYMNLSEVTMKNVSGDDGFAPAKNGTFRVDAGAPSVTNPDANPDTIVADGVQESRLNVTVVDDIAVDVVVTVNLAQIGGPEEKIMEIIDGTLYSTTTNASIGITPATYYLPINATDLLGNYNNTETFTLNVEAPANGSIVGQITYACNGSWIPEVIVDLTKGVSVEATTMTNETGYYNFTDVTPDSYFVNASKPRFWDNSTEVAVTAGLIEEVNMMLWLKGDLDNDGISASEDDLVMMFKAYLEFIEPDWRYDLDEDGEFADEDDLVMMFKAYLEFITLE